MNVGHLEKVNPRHTITARYTTHTPSEAQVVNGSNFGPWNGPVFLENVMCAGTEAVGTECPTPGVGVITDPECNNPSRTAGVRCIASELSKTVCSLITFTGIVTCS